MTAYNAYQVNWEHPFPTVIRFLLCKCAKESSMEWYIGTEYDTVTTLNCYKIVPDWDRFDKFF